MKTRSLLLATLALLFCGPVFAQTRPVQIIWEQTAFPGGAASVEFSPDGQTLGAGGAYCVQTGAEVCYGQVKTFTARGGTLLSASPEDFSIGGVNEVSFSPDGQQIATANGTVYCFPEGGCDSNFPGLADYSTAGLVRQDLQRTDPINASIDFSPDGTLLATGEFYGDFMIRLRSATDLSVIRTLPGHSTPFGQEGTFSVRFSPDGTLLASGGVDGTVKIFRVVDGVLLMTLPINDQLFPTVLSVAFSPDGQLIAAGNEFGFRTVRVWQVSDGQLVESFFWGGNIYGTPSQSNLAWTPDSKYLVGGVKDGDSPLTIRFWNVTTGQLGQELTDNSGRSIYSIALHPSGRRFAYAASTDVVVARTPRLR